MLFVSVEFEGGLKGAGSAFVVEEDGEQWIYTNAHNVEGALKIVFHDQGGELVQGFGKFQCYATGCGEIELKGSQDRTVRFGGDGVRLKLQKNRDIALAIHHEPDKVSKGLEVVTLGDNDGDKTLETLEGEILVSNGKVVMTSCASRPGCSGGALLDAESLKVIGLHTWGFPSDAKVIDKVWAKEGENPDAKLAGASILGNADWADVTIVDFIKGAKHQREYLETLKVLMLIYNTTPTKSGFRVGWNDPFTANLTHSEAFDQLSRNQILRPVASLNEKLGRAAGSNIGINNMEVVSTYAKAIKEIRASYAKESTRILHKTPPYYRLKLQNLGAIEFGDECHKNLSKAEEWFTAKASVGGTMPVGDWFALPSLGDF